MLGVRIQIAQMDGKMPGVQSVEYNAGDAFGGKNLHRKDGGESAPRGKRAAEEDNGNTNRI